MFETHTYYRILSNGLFLTLRPGDRINVIIPDEDQMKSSKVVGLFVGIHGQFLYLSNVADAYKHGPFCDGGMMHINTKRICSIWLEGQDGKRLYSDSDIVSSEPSHGIVVKSKEEISLALLLYDSKPLQYSKRGSKA